jgi:hypothetical protein
MASKKMEVGRRQFISALGVAAGALTLGGGAKALASREPAEGEKPQPKNTTPVTTREVPDNDPGHSDGTPDEHFVGQKAQPTARNTPAPKVLELPNPQPTAGRDVAAFFGPIRPGTRLGGTRVRAVHGVHMGGVAVVLETADGARVQVDVLRRAEGVVKGVATTRHLSLYLSNDGNGQQASHETHGLAIMALARALARREEAGARPPALLTLPERNARFPRGVYDGKYLA